jgi:hypothetical protein
MKSHWGERLQDGRRSNKKGRSQAAPTKNQNSIVAALATKAVVTAFAAKTTLAAATTTTTFAWLKPTRIATASKATTETATTAWGIAAALAGTETATTVAVAKATTARRIIAATKTAFAGTEATATTIAVATKAATTAWGIIAATKTAFAWAEATTFAVATPKTAAATFSSRTKTTAAALAPAEAAHVVIVAAFTLLWSWRVANGGFLKFLLELANNRGQFFDAGGQDAQLQFDAACFFFGHLGNVFLRSECKTIGDGVWVKVGNIWGQGFLENVFFFLAWHNFLFPPKTFERASEDCTRKPWEEMPKIYLPMNFAALFSRNA